MKILDEVIPALILVLTLCGFLFGVAILGSSGIGVITLIEVNRYMSPIGKVLSVLLAIGGLVFLCRAGAVLISYLTKQ